MISVPFRVRFRRWRPSFTTTIRWLMQNKIYRYHNPLTARSRIPLHSYRASKGGKQLARRVLVPH